MLAKQIGRALVLSLVVLGLVSSGLAEDAPRPHIVLVMTDDQGWGQTGYYGHPVLKTPALDAMAAAGLRLDRFYAGAPVCSPTRASVLTGRSNMRTGVNSHGYALRRQERTLAQALKAAGYATGHFGKWHLNGLRGPGVPILREDTHHPGVFGFDTWFSVTNFFDRNPILSRKGVFEECEGDSSEIIVREALEFIQEASAQNRPTFSVVWYGTPHDPFRALDKDAALFAQLDQASQHHYGELVAMDRSVGTLRQGLQDLGIAENTLLWFCSDNGGLKKIEPGTVGDLRGFKGSLYEGGLRVPAIVEWPAVIEGGRVSEMPCVTMDIFPTIADFLALESGLMTAPQDGVSLAELFRGQAMKREVAMPFHCFNQTALLEMPYKLIHFPKKEKGSRYELYHLGHDPVEENNLYEAAPGVARRMTEQMTVWLVSMRRSVEGRDYAEGSVLPGEPEPRFWMGEEAYRPFLEAWKERPEYGTRIRRFENKR